MRRAKLVAPVVELEEIVEEELRTSFWELALKETNTRGADTPAKQVPKRVLEDEESDEKQETLTITRFQGTGELCGGSDRSGFDFLRVCRL